MGTCLRYYGTEQPVHADARRHLGGALRRSDPQSDAREDGDGNLARAGDSVRAGGRPAPSSGDSDCAMLGTGLIDTLSRNGARSGPALWAREAIPSLPDVQPAPSGVGNP